ncbi:MAG TPA: S41 family peptidase, partial [Planctomycetota bacterium]|nr:S41 family peptidase [Planctomycetota bacterium]
DRIIEINGLPTADRTLEEIQTLLADLDEGDTVFLRFARGLDEPRSLRLRYGSLEVPPIVAERVAPAIGWIRIRSFPAGASRAFEAAYDALAADGPPLEGLIVDVRDNPGGVLDEATSIVDLFVAGESEGRPIVSERRFDGRPPVEHLLSPGRKIDEPVIVIVDSATASAAEVLAGSLQAYHRAVVVGERTWGKGVAQDTFEVPPAVRHLVGGAARVRLPTRFLVLPNGLGFHRQAPGAPAMRGGIVPDVHVADDPSFTDERLLAAFYASETSAYLFEHRELIESLPEIARWRKESHPALDDLSCALIEKHGVRVDDDELLEVLKRLSWRHADDREGKRRSRAPDDDLPLERAIELLRG